MAVRDPSNAHWRDSARTPKFFGIDAFATFPLLLFFLHITWNTFILAIVCTLFFGILQRFGFTVLIFRRWIVNFIGGPQKKARL